MKPIRLLSLCLIGLAGHLSGLAQPSITTHPKSQSVSLGANVSFQVKAAGTAPLNYQWRFSGTNISGAVTNSLNLTNAQLLHAGDYEVVVTDANGSATSKPATLGVDPTFTKITSGSIVTDRGVSAACAWGDYDNDDWIDLFVTNGDNQNYLYRNNGDGKFTRIVTGHLVTDKTVMHLAGVWGDYDNDGFLDLLVVNGGCCAGNQRNFLYHNNGDGTFSQQTADSVGEIATDTGGFHGAAWGDYDGDGYMDVFVANFTERNYLYHNVGGTKFEKVLDASSRPLNLGTRYAEAAWADYDSDGYLDLLAIQHFPNSGQKTLLYRNNSQGVLTPVPSGAIISEGSSSAGASWADYDNDGFFDLFVSNINLERDFAYRNKGDGTFEKITNRAPVNEGADTYGATWGDYDNDGYLDLFVANGAFGNGPLDNSLFHNKGDGTFQKISAGSPGNDKGNSFGCAWADYDNDGFLDLFVTNDPTPQNNFLYRNNGNSNSWLKVRLKGAVSNRTGIGAKVRVKARISGQDRWQLRQIASSDGRTGGSLEAHFGFGDATSIDTVRIEWPSGTVQELQGVAMKQHLTVTEPSRLQVLGLGAFRVQSWKGMAFEVQASTDLKQWSPVTVVTNLTGTLEFTDSGAANHLRRFYRAVRQ